MQNLRPHPQPTRWSSRLPRIGPTLRPYIVLVLLAAVLWGLDGGHGRFLSVATLASVLQQFATLGPFALALGLSMIVREFDLSIAGMLSFAGCVAVLLGQQHPLIGIAVALALGLAVGAVQGLLIVRLQLASVGVTLGGLLTLSGLSYVLTGNAVLGFDHAQATLAVNAPLAGVFTLRSLLALAAFGLAAVVMAFTRIGRDVVAAGSHPRAALIAGVPVPGLIVAVFALSGLLTALAGSLLSYSLAAASPIALADVLIPATAAAILGGVSLAGGRGTPLGIAGGVLVLCLLRSGLTAIGAKPYVQDVLTGAVLLAVAVADAPDLRMRLRRAMKRWGSDRGQ